MSSVRRLPWAILATIALVAVALAALAPWPGALLIRWLFERDGARVARKLRAHAPDGVESITGLRYRADDRDAILDVHLPAGPGPGDRLPAVIWTHGGAWLSGSRTDVVPYFQLIAAEGYAVVSLDYSLAPRATYPTPVRQVNDALGYVREHAERSTSTPAGSSLRATPRERRSPARSPRS